MAHTSSPSSLDPTGLGPTGLGKGVLPWLQGGLVLGAVFFLAVALVKPIGVSTQFVIANAAVWDLVDPGVITPSETAKSGYESTNAYLNKSSGKYAASAMDLFNYSFVFVLAMAAGAFLSSILGGDRPQPGHGIAPPVWRARFGDSPLPRMIAVFLAGFLVLYGARMAGGCTSGHMMSGMMQTAVSGYLFTAAAFAAGIPAALLLYGKARA